MKKGIIIGLFTLLCSPVLGQIIINADGTHSIQHGPHIINPNGTISVQHGPHIIHPDGSISVAHGSTIVNTTNPTHPVGETANSSAITVSNNQKFLFNLRLGSAADRLDRLDAERTARKNDRKLKRNLLKLWHIVTH